MYGVYYLLSEHKSFFQSDECAVKAWKILSEDPNSCSPFGDLFSNVDPSIIDIGYVKRNAFARINDGKIESSERLIFDHYFGKVSI